MIEVKSGERQAPFARKIGATPQMLSRWIKDVHFPEERYAEKIAEAGGVTVAWLRYGDEAMPDAAREPGAAHSELDVSDAEQWLQGLLTPNSLRRIVRTYEGRQMVKALRGVIADLEWPAEKKRAADALLSDALLDAGPAER